MPYGYGSANRGSSGPGPGGQGARGQATQNPGRAPTPTYQNVHQTGAVTQTPGRTVVSTASGPPGILNPPTPPTTVTTAAGPPRVLNPQPFNYGRFRKNTARNNLWSKWQRHKLMSHLMKEGKLKDYHQLGAHDFTQRFDIPDWLSKGLATTYQYASELGRQFIPVNKNNIYTAISKDLKKDKPFEPLGAAVGSISDALGRAKEESRLGHKGIEGLTGSQQEIYNQYAKTWDPILNTMYKADGGLIDFYRYGGFSG